MLEEKPEIWKVECCLLDNGFDVFFDNVNRKHYFQCRVCRKKYKANPDDR